MFLVQAKGTLAELTKIAEYGNKTTIQELLFDLSFESWADQLFCSFCMNFKSKRVIKTLTNLQKQNKEELKNYKYIYY